jgi:hypothetical protein
MRVIRTQDVRNFTYKKGIIIFINLIFLIILQNIIISYVISSTFSELGLSYNDLPFLRPAFFKYLEYLLYLILLLGFLLGTRFSYNKFFRKTTIITVFAIIAYHTLTFIYFFYCSFREKKPLDLIDFTPIIWSIIFFFGLRFLFGDNKVEKVKR